MHTPSCLMKEPVRKRCLPVTTARLESPLACNRRVERKVEWIMSEQKKVVAHPHTFPFQLCKVQLRPGDATGTTIRRERRKQVWIKQILPEHWAKSRSTTEDGEVVIIYTGITQKDESGNLTPSKGIRRQASSSTVREKRSGKTQPDFRAENPLISQTLSMSSGANALPSSAEGACPGAPQEIRGTHNKCHRPIFAAKEQLPLNQRKCSRNDEASAKAKREMNRNMLSHPQPSVPLRSFLLFYKLTYCSKSQIFRNSTGWRYYQEKRSASANQCNWGILSSRLRQRWQMLENQNPREGEARATWIHRQEAAGPTFDSASDVLFCRKQVRSLTKTVPVFW